jgi:3-deoxy-7-phosphoheptulonate synthase
MAPAADAPASEHGIARLTERGFDDHRSTGAERTVLGVVGPTQELDTAEFELLPGVEEVVRVSTPYKLVSRAFHPEDTLVRVGEVVFGGDEVVVAAGPCSVESEEQIRKTAAAVRAAGARLLRGGAFKPRSSPYSFQGMGEEGLRLLRAAADEQRLGVVTEVMDASQIELVAAYADMLQVGARNMQNYTLLRELGKAGKPVLLKRGLSATIEEWLLSAEYVAASGNQQVVLCERGIRTFETATRNTLDLSMVPLIKKLSHLPIVIDPSHGTGKADLVPAMALAAVAAGADALMIEMHPNPDKALSDGAQSLNPAQFADLIPRLATVAEAVGRRLATVGEAVAAG